MCSKDPEGVDQLIQHVQGKDHMRGLTNKLAEGKMLEWWGGGGAASSASRRREEFGGRAASSASGNESQTTAQE
eukprot:6593907-Prorocentrum_lima.AAC.1